MKYPLFKKRTFDEFPVVSETFSSPKRRDAFSRLGDQVCGIISLISKALQFAETQKCVSTIFPRTYVKKIVVLLFLAFTAATQAVGQITFTPSTDINPSKEYKLDAVAEGNSVSASFASKLNEIKAELNNLQNVGQGFYMRWFVKDKDDVGYQNIESGWDVNFSFPGGHLVETEGYGTAWCSNGNWINEETAYCSATITTPNGVDSKDYQIVCLITDNQGYTFQGNVLTETNIKIAVVFNIKTLDDVLADYPYPDLGSLQKIEKTIVYDNDAATIDLSLTDYRNEIPGYGEIKYLHLYLTDKEGRVIPGNAFALKEDNTNPDTKVASSVVGYHLYYTNQYYGSLFMENNRAQYVVTKPQGYSWENLRVVAVFANSIAGMGTYGDYVISEPSTLTTAAIFTFKTLEDVLADYPYPDLTSIQTIEKDLVYDGDVATIDLSLTDYKDEIQDYDKIKYLHLYLTDKDGKVIPSDVFALKETNTDGNLMETSSNVGYHLYYTDQRWETLFGNGNNNRARFVITKPDGSSWENLRVVAVFANSIAGMGTYGDYVISEPSTLTTAAIFTFKTLEDVLADYPYPDLTSIQTIEKDLVYDGDVATIDLSLTDYKDEIQDYDKIKYLHLYLTDKDGKVIPSDVFALKETNTDGNLMETSSNVGYHLYYTDQRWETLFGNGNNNRARFVITKPDGSSWENLRVVAVFANSIAGMGTYGDYVISEPSTLTAAAIFTFKTLDDALEGYTLPDISRLPTHEVEIMYKAGDKSFVLDFFPYMEQLKADYNTGTFPQTKFLHFYVIDENNGAIKDIYDATFTPENPSYPNRSAVPTPFGWYVYANGDNNAIFSEGGQSDARFTFSKPDDLDWAAIKVVAVLTDDVTGWEMNSGYVLKNPDRLKSAFVFTFKKMGFRHYEGIANKPGEWDEVNGNKMQLTHEWTYDKYVKPGETITLTLPMRFDKGPGTSATGDEWEPQGYFRWYNYQTDAASTNLSQENCGTKLVPMFDAESDENKGLFQWDIYHRFNQNPTPENVAAIEYKAPASNWNGEAIACDVSRYIDGVDPSSRALLHEPTLSIRYIYNVYPAQKIADDIKNAIINSPEAVYETNGYTSICTNATASDSSNRISANIRLKLQEVGDYYFYPYKKCNENNVKPSKADFETSSGPVQAQKVVWRVFTSLGTQYKDLTTEGGKMYSLSLQGINNNGTWHDAGGGMSTNLPRPFVPGDMVYVIAYLSDGNGKMCPVARFNCRFYANTPPLPYAEGESASSLPEHRKLSYLRQNYNEVAVLNFDNDSPESTLAAPTTALDNMTGNPSQWNRRFYGFVYKGLYDQNDNDFLGLSPKHGDYGLYKSMNVPGVSEDQVGGDRYQHEWYYTSSPFYDRTYEMTRGSQSGYFLYVDASEEARQIAAINFDGELCAGSTVVISAAVADLTDAATKPQLLFKLYGITENASGEITDRKLIHSFATGNFSDFGVESGKWYQVYVKSTLQYGTGVESFHKFLVVVDNYCDNTEGADYAIDDIRIYTRNSSVEVAQTSIPCEELGGEESHIPTAKYKVKILHETLIAWLDAEKNWICHGKSPTDPFYKYFYYRLCKADGTPVEGVSYRVANKIGEGYTTSQEWGRCRVFRSFTNKPEEIDDAVYKYDEVNNLYYIIVDDLTIPVPADGEKYYVSLCWPQLGDGKGTDEELEAQLNGPGGNWGTPIDICSAYSSLFEAIAQQPSITDGEGNVVGSLTIPCNEDPQPMELRVQLIVPDPVNGGTYTLTGDKVMYNWFVVKDGRQKKLAENVSTYSYTYKAEDISDDGKLHLRLVPVTTQVIINGEELDLCVNPMDLALAVRTSGPQLELGFKEVTYQENTTRTVRVGLGQLDSMRNERKKLVLPVHSYENMVESEDFHLAVKEENSSVTVVSTNDPTWTDITNREIGKVTGLTADNAIITIDIPEGGGAFHEGYAYDLSFQFYDEEHDKTLTKGQETCYGDAFFTLKIVPEYVTWTGAANEMMSTNWNNDQNWARSLQKEIYKNDYTDYGEGDYAELTRQQAYVPMKFTKVTLPANMQSPRLAELGYSGEGIINNGLLNEFSYDATEDIEYDLMVKIDKDLNTDYDGDSENDYDCEKFYGNTCQDIYFKPQAELRHQEELVYERAWMEYEFQANKWQLLTSPLKNVYSGDMYVPKSNGRQETEAFIDIEFDGGASGIYSRVGYPIYQRSWGKTVSMVVVSKEDDYRHDYPADIDYGSWGAGGNESAVVLNQWSHSYNDATVAYAPGNGDNGFSLRAHKRDQQGAKALIRLPKADISYNYYNIEDGVEDEQSGGHDAVSKDEGNKHNLLADAQTEGDYAPVTMTLNNSGGNDIYLVSNPYMASLDMNLFFEANADVIDESCRKLWTIVDGEVKVSPTESGVQATIAPGQAFFIKVPGGNGKEVKFTTNMVTNQKVDFNGNLQAAMAKFTEAERRKRAQQALVMTARSDGKKSTAIVRLNTEADEDFQDREDVETLYDSNLTDVPTLYTIAGDQAVSVNSLPAIGAVPLGIVCATDTQAEVTFSGVSAIPGELYLYDRETGSSTLLSDSVKLHLQANAHGRYFLTGQRVTSGITNHEVKGIRCYSPAPGQLTIACLDAGNQLERVDIYTIDGKKEYSNNDINAPALTIRTHRGVKVVVIKHTGNNYAETAKVAVN